MSQFPTYTYSLTVKGGPKVLSAFRAYFLDAAKQPILVNGQATFVEFLNGSNSITAIQSPLNVRVSASGYADKVVTLMPGANEINLDTATEATAKDNLKKLVMLIVVVAIVYLLLKYTKAI